MATIYKKNDEFGLISDDGNQLTNKDFDKLEPFRMEKC